MGWVGGLVGRLVDSLAEVDQQQLLDTGASDHPTDRFWALKGLRPDPMCVYIYLDLPTLRNVLYKTNQKADILLSWSRYYMQAIT